MALRSETRTIDGLDVTTTQLPAMRSFVLLGKLLKIAGPALGELGEANIGKLVSMVAQSIDPAELPGLAREVLEQTTVISDGRQVQLNSIPLIDNVFNGRLPTLLKVLRFALENGYSGFFDDGSLNFDGLVPAAASPAQANP